jgi:8-oxo-dGTP pyrophosphatase MutT (NUDIX family)
MSHGQPFVSVAAPRGSLPCSPVGVAAFIVDERERLLLFSSQAKRGSPGGWEVPSGALEAGETLLDGVLREVREELGERICVRPLGVIHAYSYRYEANIPYMAGICFLLAYEGGEIVPGDDMRGCEARWVGRAELESDALRIVVPIDYPWLPVHAIETYRQLRRRPAVELQAPLRRTP